MATCPNCGGYLHTRHQCRGLWRIRLLMFADLFLCGITGGGLAIALFFYLDGQVAPLAILPGAIIAVILRWTVITGAPPRFGTGA